MWNYIAIAVGGTLGCWARHALNGPVQTAFGRDFPYATLLINVLGSFAIGFFFIATLERLTLPPALRIGVVTGLLGGFTTFSTFSLEALLLAEAGEIGKAVLYVGLSVALALSAAFAGAYLARHF